MRRFLPRFREPLIREPFFSRFRNCENVIEEPRERGELQAIAVVPPARQSGRVRHRRTARRERGAGEPKRGQKGSVKKGSGPLLAFSHKPGSPRRRKFLSPLGLLVHRGLISNLLSHRCLRVRLSYCFIGAPTV